MKTPEDKIIEPEIFDYRHIGMGFFALLGISAATILLLVFGAIRDPRQFAFSYLFAYLFFFTIVVGSIFWTMVHHAVDAEWSVVVRRQLENLGGLIVAMAVLFLPLVFVAPLLWTWMSPAHAHDPLLLEKKAYLNQPFFWIRAVVYFACFSATALLLRSRSIAQDTDGVARYTILNRQVSFGSMIPFGLGLTFASIDWLMGLDYRWYSTIWGVYIFAGSALAALCALVLIITTLRAAGYLQVVTVEHYHIMGKLLLTFTIFWAYIGFDQYVVIWYSNIPEETIYFLQRTTGSWWDLSQFLVIGHFFIPFLLLLFLRSKRKPALLCGLAAWILLMHALDIYIMVLPALRPNGVAFSRWDFVSFVAIGSVLALVFLKRLGDSSLYPVRDPRLAQSLALKN